MTTDEDVRTELRLAAVEAAKALRKGIDGTLLDDCDRDSKAAHNIVHAAEITIGAWAKSLPQRVELAPGKPSDAGTVDEAIGAMLGDPPPRLLEIARRAGVAIVPMTAQIGAIVTEGKEPE